MPVADGYLAIALRAACPDSATGRDPKPGHRSQMGSLNTKDPSEVAKAWLGLHQCSALRCVHTVCCNSTSGLHAQSASHKGQVTCLGSSCVFPRHTSLAPFCLEGFSSSYSHGFLSLVAKGRPTQWREWPLLRYVIIVASKTKQNGTTSEVYVLLLLFHSGLFFLL